MSISEFERRSSATMSLARLGFADPEAAQRRLSEVGLDADHDAPVLRAVADAADPDLALAGLARLIEAARGRGIDEQRLRAAVNDDERLRARLLGVLGVSAALADHLERHPADWEVLAAPDRDLDESAAALRADLLTAVGGDPADGEPRAGGADPGVLDALRAGYRRALLPIAGRDVTGAATLDSTAAELSDLAAGTLDAALAVARAELPAGSPPCRLAVIAMGKCGGRELNYVSDVDVVFVAEARPGVDEQAALRTATALASGLMRACSATTAEGTIWPVDAALRPEGKAGPLVRTLDSHLAYYGRWARTWEFQALLKARPIAGDVALGSAYVEAIAPLVWRAAERDGFVAEVQQMRRRVEETIPRRHADRQLKLGRGGLRDVEFAVQLLQLVHGRADPALRSGTTLVALEALRDGGYVGRDDGAAMAAAYRFLRSLEHRMQLHRLRRIHVVPEQPADLRRLGRSLGFRSDPVEELTEEWRRQAREVRRIHEKLFYRPLLHAVARLPGDETRLSPAAARARLEALGYADPAGALRHLEALTTGVSRRAAIQRTLLPVLLGWFADAPDPDGGLLAFRQVSDALGATPWYLRLLRDEGVAAERMARVLASSRYASDLLLRAPEAVAMLANDEELRPRAEEALTAESLAAVRRYDNSAAAAAAARGLRRRELFRIGVADLLGLLPVEAVGEALSAVAAATVRAALEVARRQVETEVRRPLPARFAVIAMGRFGGHELGYSSDADVLFLFEPEPGVAEKVAHDAAQAVALELRRLLSLPAPDPPLPIDADLRPEGRQGPLVRTLGSYAAYYGRWSHIWEAQALLRAEPVAGDDELGARFVALIDPVRWPQGGLADAEVREVRRIKARVESERLPRGADPTRHTKLGRGGLADVEWTVQLLQLRHAAQVPALRTTRTLAGIEAAARAGLLERADADVLAESWRLATQVRNAAMLVRGRPSDSIPADVRELAGVARLLGHPPGETGALLDRYQRTTRRARAVVEKVFYE